MNKRKNFFFALISASRPKTLTAAVVPVLVAVALAFSLNYVIGLTAVFSALFSALFLQVGTNFINDALDFEKGADTKERLGPLRASQSGILRVKQVYGLGFLAFFLGFLAAIPLFIQGGWPIFILFAFSVLAGYSYTAGPFPLAYLGLGELFVFLFFGLAITGGVFYSLTGEFGLKCVLAGSQMGVLACVLIAINNLRDLNQDEKAAKKTLAVRFGVLFARGEITTFVLVPYILGLVWVFWKETPAFFLPLLTLPFSAKLIYFVWVHQPSALYNYFLEMGALLHLLFGLLLSLGLVLNH